MDDIPRKRRIGQDELKYVYEHAKARMEYNPEIAEKYKQVIQDYPYFKEENDAIKYAIELKMKGHYHCQIWAKIGKDEEYFYIQDYYIVSNDIKILIAAEYVGMAQLYTSC